MNKLDNIDRKILNIMQNEFPVSPQPYRDLAERLNISEDEVLQRVQAMKDQGVIRRIGAIIDSRKMGYYSTLCACQVEKERIDEVAQVINAQKGVTHNYIRDHKYNLWFTLTAPSYENAVTILEDIEAAIRVKVVSMPASKLYKIKVSLNMGDKHAN